MLAASAPETIAVAVLEKESNKLNPHNKHAV